MAERGAVRRWMLLVIGGGSALLAMLAPGEAGAVVRACCFPAGTCQMLNRSVCEDQQGGISQAVGTTCDTVTCPLLCAAAGPECDGQCPTGTTCVNPYGGGAQQAGATTSAVSLCQCVPEIPLGGACEAQPDACVRGLECVNGICAAAPAAAPVLSGTGLAMAVASLVALAGLAFVRRRRPA